MQVHATMKLGTFLMLGASLLIACASNGEPANGQLADGGLQSQNHDCVKQEQPGSDTKPASHSYEKFDWLEGNWIGCENEFLHEKAMSSSLGDVFLAANKIFKKGAIVSRGYLEIVPSFAGKSATMTFLTGTSVERTLVCDVSDLRLKCEQDDGSFAVEVSLAKGETRDADVLTFEKTHAGKTATLTMSRRGRETPSCD